MRYVDINDLAVREPDALEVIQNFIDFAAEELGLEQLPQIVLMTGNELGTTFGAYVPGKKIIYLEIGNRHPVDVLRTLAHELVHFRQDLEDVLHDKSGEDGSDHENEANSEAGRVMRKFGKANPSLYRASAIIAEALEGAALPEAWTRPGNEILHQEEGDPGDIRVFAGRAPDSHSVIEYQADGFSWKFLRRILWEMADEAPSIRFQIIDRLHEPRIFIMGEKQELQVALDRLNAWMTPHLKEKHGFDVIHANRFRDSAPDPTDYVPKWHWLR